MLLENIDNGESDPQACPLPPAHISEEENTSIDTSVTSHSSTLALGSQVKKFFQGLGWFFDEVVNTFIDDGNTQMYTIRYTDG